MYVHIPMYLYKCSSLNQMDINAQMHVYIYTHGYAHTSIFPFENVCVYIHVYTCINVSLPCIASAKSEKSFCASISVANCTEEGSSTALVLCERLCATERMCVHLCMCVCACACECSYFSTTVSIKVDARVITSKDNHCAHTFHKKTTASKR